MRTKYLLRTAALGMACMIAGCSSASAETLKVGVRDDIVNFSYLNPDTEQYYGFEVDLAASMAKKMGYSDVTYVTVNPDDRESKLEGGEVDCLVAAYSITDERKEKFDFSPSYYEDISGIVVEKTSLITELKDLVGLRLGGLTGTNTEDELKKKMIDAGLITDADVKGTTFQFCDSYEEMVTDLEEGTLDAICMDGCIAHSFMDEESMILEDVIGTQDYGVATVKGSALSEKTAAAVQSMLEDGTIDALKDKWD